MAGGYDVTPVEPLDVLREELRGVKARLSELERPTGTQFAELVSKSIVPQSGHGETSNFGLTTTPTELTRITFTVPAGSTRALVMGATGVTALNPDSLTAFPLKAYCDINGATSASPLTATLDFTSQTAVFPSVAATLTGLTAGSTFYVRLVSYTIGSTIPTNSLNRATVDASVMFLP